MKPAIIVTALLAACIFTPPALAAQQRITAQPFCIFSTSDVIVQTIVEMRYTGNSSIDGRPMPPDINRTLWLIDCSRITGDCGAVSISLTNADAGKPIQFRDVLHPVGLRLTSLAGKVATISRGVETITVDLAKKQLEYRVSGKTMEGIGHGSCDNGW
jgi:hypothetical protein